MWQEGVRFAVPQPHAGRHWARIIDTAPWAEVFGNFREIGQADIADSNYWVNPYSVVVLLEMTIPSQLASTVR
jgi:hypothetical protein